MKKLFYLTAVLFMSVMSVSADNDQMIKRSELPQASQAFIDKHFKGVEVSYATKETEMTITTGYEVVLTNGVKIEFDRKGEWESVDVKKTRMTKMPDAIVPAKINSYINDYFKGVRIIEIDRDMFGYEVSLDNGIDVEFDNDGDFKRIDD